jgi:hypothetical protein
MSNYILKLGGKEIPVQLEPFDLPAVSKESGHYAHAGTLSAQGLILLQDMPKFQALGHDTKVDVSFDMGGTSFTGTGFLTSLTDATPKGKATYKRFRKYGRRVLKISLHKPASRSYEATLQVKI